MNNDLISREALKKAIKEKFDNFIPEGVYDEIDNAPTVEPERLQGEWIAHEDMDEWYKCNKCHCGNTYFDKLPNFCPNCGADMRKGSAENDT